MPSYKLSVELHGHSSDVRGLAFKRDVDSIISCSRDRTARLWNPTGNNGNYVESMVVTEECFVNTVCAFPATKYYKNGLIVVGVADGRILCYEPKQSNPVIMRKEHSKSVCKVVVGERSNDTLLLSASWDNSAKVWTIKNFQLECMLTLQPHGDKCVWSIAYCKSGFFVTASADSTLAVSNENGMVCTKLKGHTEAVRDVVALQNDDEVISCSNDGTVKHWNIRSGACLHTYTWPSHFLYSVSYLHSKPLIVSCGELGRVNIFDTELQSIDLPVESVWSVIILPNTDIVVGSSDGVIRIFTTDKDRVADEEAQKMFKIAVESCLKERAEKVAGKLSNVQDASALSQPGKEGEKKIIKENGKAVCYVWSNKEFKWDRIGEVVGVDQVKAPLEKTYDYMVDVEIDGKPFHKLGFNKGDDPWITAHQYVIKHNLPMDNVEQVVDFINKQLGIENPQPYISEYSDPFTGSSRYIPGSSTSSVNASNGNPVVNAYFPREEYYSFEPPGNTEKVLQKLKEFNEMCLPDKKIAESDLSILVGLASLEEPTAEHVDKLKNILAWDKELVFPALDLVAMAVRKEKWYFALLTDNEIIEILKKHLQPNAVIVNQQLALRVFCNVLRHPPGVEFVYKHLQFLIDTISQFDAASYTAKGFQFALTSLMVNLVLLLQKKDDIENQSALLFTFIAVLPRITFDETFIRYLIGLGTMFLHVPLLKNTFVSEALPILKIKVDEARLEKVKECASYIF